MAPTLGEAPWSGILLAWSAADGQIYYWDGTTVKRLTEDATLKTNPSLYNGRVAWNGYDGTDYEIYYAQIDAPPSGGGGGASNIDPLAVDDDYAAFGNTILVDDV